jgi:SAM-dependent methyltransferase
MATKLYDELSDWWPLLSVPADYADEAEFCAGVLKNAVHPPPTTVLELGSGGGNNAFHFKKHFRMTLVDISEGMLNVSRQINPECIHVVVDMREVRLGREFDAVFVHDAIMYMVTEDDLLLAMATAFVHCRPGGAALFVPDCVRETFSASTDHGGHDGERRSLRYLQWIYDPDPNDSTFISDFVYAMRDENGAMRIEHDRHVN